jgi:uncharacterized protein YjbI with pentapeptide repeats
VLLVGFGLPAITAGIDLPVVTGATADLEGGVLTIRGRNFVTSPQPRVQIGTEAGGFQELVVEGGTSGSIVARLTGQSPGTYRVVVQFGRTGLVIGTLDVTIGTTGPSGPKGDKGDKGEKGDKGDPGPGVDFGIADARYAKLFGNNVYSGNQVIAGAASVLGPVTALSVEVDGPVRVRDSIQAESFVGDGSGLTNVGVVHLGDACVVDHIPGRDSGDGEPDALGVIVGFESDGRRICRPLVATECKVVPIGDGPDRWLVGKQRLELFNDAPPVDASNCTVPNGGVVHVGRRPNLSGARLGNVLVSTVEDWSFADLSRSELEMDDQVVMVGANLRGATIATSKGPDMRFADATGAVFPVAFVSEVIADDATLALASFQLGNAPRNSFRRADLRMANLSPKGGGRPTNTTFADANLFRANLTGNDCRSTDTAGCDFTRASLREANLQRLRCATPSQLAPSCDFTQADLTGADLTGAQLSSVVLEGTIWSNTTCPDGTNSDLPDGDGSTCLSNLGGT